MNADLVAATEHDLAALAGRFPDRHPGRPGNTAANDHVEAVLREHGWDVDSAAFDVIDGEAGVCRLAIDEREFEIAAGPYSVPVDGSARLVAVDSTEALDAADIDGAVVLLHGAIAADQLFPKSFDFVDAPEHRRIYALLETGRPSAVIAATGRGAGMGGGLYPYPLIEDGDFDIPNAYTTDVIGEQLAPLAGRVARLHIDARRLTASARQLRGSRGPEGAPRAIVIAHIDSKGGSPGALDNATGVAALLASARLLADYDGPYRVELWPMNGEDYYASTGEHLFVADNEGRWDELVGTINMDAIGARGALTAASMYAVSDAVRDLVQRVVRRHRTVSLGEEWYESDHSIVAGHGRPAIAMTSTSFRELSSSVTHTERDTLELVDPVLVAAAAAFVADLVRSLPAIGGIEG